MRACQRVSQQLSITPHRRTAANPPGSAPHRRSSAALRRSRPKWPPNGCKSTRISASSPIIGNTPPIPAQVAPERLQIQPDQHLIADHRQRSADSGPNGPRTGAYPPGSALCRRSSATTRRSRPKMAPNGCKSTRISTSSPIIGSAPPIPAQNGPRTDANPPGSSPHRRSSAVLRRCHPKWPPNGCETAKALVIDPKAPIRARMSKLASIDEPAIPLTTHFPMAVRIEKRLSVIDCEQKGLLKRPEAQREAASAGQEAQTEHGRAQYETQRAGPVIPKYESARRGGE